MNIPKQQTTKFDSRARKMVLVGYEANSSNYRVYDPKTKKVSVSRDVVFRERITKSTLSTGNESHEETTLPKVEREAAQERNPIVEQEAEDDVFLPAEEQTQKEKPQLVARVENRQLRDRGSLRKPTRYELNVAEYDVPTTYQEAMESEDVSKWISAIEKELEAHEENGTWSQIGRAHV